MDRKEKKQIKWMIISLFHFFGEASKKRLLPPREQSICSVWGTRTHNRALIPWLFLEFVTEVSLVQVKLFPLRKQRPEAFCRQMEVFRITKGPEMVEGIRKVEPNACGWGLSWRQPGLTASRDPTPTARSGLWSFASAPCHSSSLVCQGLQLL